MLTILHLYLTPQAMPNCDLIYILNIIHIIVISCHLIPILLHLTQEPTSVLSAKVYHQVYRYKPLNQLKL